MLVLRMLEVKTYPAGALREFCVPLIPAVAADLEALTAETGIPLG